MKDQIPNRHLVVYALYLLGGESKRVHTEDIAVKCFELAPSSFSWTRYPQYPDKDIVRVALTDAHKQQHGCLVEGRTGQRTGLATKTNRDPVPDGWILTPGGVEWVRVNASRFERSVATQEAKEHRQGLLRQLRRLRDHQLFRDFQAAPDRFAPTIGDLADLLRCRVDAAPAVWTRRLEKHRGQAQAAGQGDVVEFLERCQAAYQGQA